MHKLVVIGLATVWGTLAISAVTVAQEAEPRMIPQSIDPTQVEGALVVEPVEDIQLDRVEAGQLYEFYIENKDYDCLLYTSPSPRDKRQSRMPSSA